MLARHRTAAWLLGAVLATASVGSAGPKDALGGKSARDEDGDDAPKPKKVEVKVDVRKDDAKGGGDLAARLENLERQVKELTNLVKSRLAGGTPGKAVEAGGDKRPADKVDGKKPEGKAEFVDKFVKKGEGKPEAKRPDAEGGKGRLGLVKGPDGQLLVPLSALPPELQKQVIAHFKEHGQNDAGEKGPGKVEVHAKKLQPDAQAKKPEPKKLDKGDGDGGDQPKKPTKGDAGPGEKPGKEKDRD